MSGKIDVLSKNISVKIFKRLGEGLINGFEGNERMFDFTHIQRENI